LKISDSGGSHPVRARNPSGADEQQDPGVHEVNQHGPGLSSLGSARLAWSGLGPKMEANSSIAPEP